MENELVVMLTRTRDKKPLAIIDNFPGRWVDMTPDQLRAMAQTLLLIASDCESRPLEEECFREIKKSYPLKHHGRTHQ